MKRCIFHYPEPVLENASVGSAIRPNRMLRSFQNLGYQVDEVTGYSWDRSKKLKKVKKNILNGIKYDFVYSENINSPLLLADKDHLPRHPFMDCRFLKFCRNNGIPVGLFYRDIYWGFPEIFNESTTPMKRAILIPAFRHDLVHYEQGIDLLYLPTDAMRKYVNMEKQYKTLPPAGDINSESLTIKKNRPARSNGTLKIIFVGSVSTVTDIGMLIRAVYETEGVELTICTHEDQWNQRKHLYQQDLCDRIQIIHKSGSELKEYYDRADVAALCFKKNAYEDMSMPIKTFEAISYGTPILTTNIDSVAQLVEENRIGWVADSSVDSISKTLNFLKEHPEEIKDKTNNTIEAAYRNSWEDRARQVAEDLTNLK